MIGTGAAHLLRLGAVFVDGDKTNLPTVGEWRVPLCPSYYSTTPAGTRPYHRSTTVDKKRPTHDRCVISQALPYALYHVRSTLGTFEVDSL